MPHIILFLRAYVRRTTSGRLIRSSVRLGEIMQLGPDGSMRLTPGYYYQVHFYSSGTTDNRFYPALEWIQ